MPSYPQRFIGTDKVSAQGLGCMGMSQAYTSFGGYDDEESMATLTKAADLGITFVSSVLCDSFEKFSCSLKVTIRLRPQKLTTRKNGN